MGEIAELAEIASLVGDPARANILSALMDGRAHTASELAYLAHVAAPTASGHLAKLRDARLIALARQGRHHYYRLASPEVARMIEAIGAVAAAAPPRHIALSRHALTMREARTCYDHLAGAVGVQLHDRWLAAGWLRAASGGADRDYELMPAGAGVFADLGIDVGAAQSRRRRFAYACLDWSERRPHLGGALAAAFLKTTLRRQWFVQDLDSRILSVTSKGRAELAARFGVQW